VRNKTITKLDIPPSAGSAAQGVTAAGDEIVFGLSTAAGTGLYTYNQATGAGSSAPVVTTAGAPYRVIYIGD
jgi:hypothetical protein